MASTLAYILHTRPWRETSLLVDVLSQDFGRIALIAKGAKRPHSPLRGLLEPFMPVQIQFSGKLGVKNLTHAHWVQALSPIHPAYTVQGWYLSELCLRALGEDDPQPSVFSAYDQAVRALTALNGDDGDAPTQTLLRQFEVQLLASLGLWPDATVDADGLALLTDQPYILDDGAGWVHCDISVVSPIGWALTGAQIHWLNQLQAKPLDRMDNDLTSLSPPPSLTPWALPSRVALRSMLRRALHGATLNTREVWKELDALTMPRLK